MTTARSSSAQVRNPIAAIPEVQALRDLPPQARLAVQAAFRAISAKARENGNKAWASHKAPMAAYWKANAVNFRHLAIAIKETR